MDAQSKQLHIVIFPWLAFGHIIPYLELSKSLSKLGHHISFISTPLNIDRLPPISPSLSPNLTLVKLTPSTIPDLPPTAQCTVDVPVDQAHLIRKVLDGLEGPFCAFLEQQHPSPDWIIYDLLSYWVPRVAHKFNLPSAYFGVLTGAAHSFIGPPSALMGPRYQPDTPDVFLGVPPWVPFPTTLRYRYHEAMQLLQSTRVEDSGLPSGYRLGKAIKDSTIVLIRSCMEFEPDWIRLLNQLYEKPVIPVGLLPPSMEEINGYFRDKWEEGKWLDSRKNGSTVYVAFGSELRLREEQAHELAHGLELSRRPFVWAYRGDPTLLPAGFEDRVAGRGIVSKGWAPQIRFLSHPAIGAFLMHGGWGSAIEALAMGKPLVMVPMIMDQGLNARVMEEKKVGVEVPRNEMDGSFTRDGVAKTLRLVLEDAEGGSIRANAEEIRKIFGNSDLNRRYLDELVAYLLDNRQEAGSS